jgi:hypothetical protein
MKSILIGSAAVVFAASCLFSVPALAQEGIAPPPAADQAAGGGRGGRGGAAAAAAMEAKINEAAAMPTPKTADGHPDLSGFWTAAGGGRGGAPGAAEKAVTPDGRTVKPIAGPEEQEIAGDTAAVARRKADTAARPAYKTQFVATAQDNFERAAHLDPSYLCQPDGVPRIGVPSEIFQRPDSVVLLYVSGANNNVYRVIPTDNRPHDPDADSMANGDSVGHWEGDTLVVDVANLSTDTWLDGDGSFHDKNLHIVERFTRQGNTLRYEATVDDPTLFAQPFTPKQRTLLLGPPTVHAAENYPCHELDQTHLTSNERH